MQSQPKRRMTGYTFMNKSLNPPQTVTPEESLAAPPQFSRRQILKAGLGGMAICVAGIPFGTFAFPSEQPDEDRVSFLDMPRTGEKRLDWETLSDWLTPQDQAFNVQHYGVPDFAEKDFKLDITGLVAKPMTLTMDDVKTLPRMDQLMT